MVMDTRENQKLLSPPRVRPAFEVRLLTRATLALILFILGFNFSNSAFFRSYPLFGLNYLAESLISIIAALLGFFILPTYLLSLRTWIEKLVTNTIYEIVSNFWYMQSKKIQESRRDKQKERARLEKQKKDEEMRGAIVIDTSVLIDGRILELVKLNFLDTALIVPQTVITELHTLSDSKDVLKRQKGRRGLDIVKDLKKKTKVVITPALDAKDGADNEVLAQAKKGGYRLATMDFNLNKVAAVAEVKVLNINALANSIKVVLLPGEELTVKIIQPGKEKQQGIAYLEDGTMLIVENAKDKIGQELNVKVMKVIQSPAGKIIFCQ